MDDQSSSSPFPRTIFQTPGTNKRPRSDSEEYNEINLQTTSRQDTPPNIRNTNQQMTSSTRIDFPPIILEFSDKREKSDRKIIEELIKTWKLKNKKNIDVIGRFGFRNNLLIFARDLATLDDLLNKSQWPNKLAEMEFKIKLPSRLPDAYSLVIQDFQSNWDENEITTDLKTKYSTLQKLTRLVARNGRPLRAVRADFSSSRDVKQLLSLGKIELNYMKLQVRQYHSPIKINKCKKCFRHDHYSSQCTSQQLCIRCGQSHAFENGCQNEIKCVNCQQNHYSGHSSCPIVQQKRKQIAEQQKLQRAQLLIQQQQSFEYKDTAFPPLSPHSTLETINPQSNTTVNSTQQKNNLSYVAITSSNNKSNPENVEQMIMALSNSINRQLSNISATLTSQISDLAKRIDQHSQRTNDIQHQIQEAIIPAIQEMAKIIDTLSQQKHLSPSLQTLQQNITPTCSETIQHFLIQHQEHGFNTPKSKSRKQRKQVTQTQSNILN